MRALLFIVGLLLPAAGQAQTAAPTRLGFTTYIAGMRVFTAEAMVDQTDAAYQVELGYRTVGMVGALFPGESQSRVTGTFAGAQPRPQRFVAWGQWRGNPRQTLIDYPRGDPVILTMVPPNESEREPVPPELQTGTVDSVSAIAMLTRQVATTGRCEGKLRIFDGRRLSEITSRTAGEETLEAERGSWFRGKAMRCDFEGRQLAGFWLDDDRSRAARPQIGSAWLARLSPEALPVPVRMEFEIRLFGRATMYLTDVVRPSELRAGPPAPATR